MSSVEANDTIRDFVFSDDARERIERNVDTYRGKWKKALDIVGDRALDDVAARRELSRTISWNWPAFLFSYYWGAWRGVKVSWLFLAWISASMLAGIFAEGSWLDKLGTYTSFPIAIVFGMFGNSWYLASLLKSRNDAIAGVRPSPLRLSLAISAMLACVLVGVFVALQSAE